MIKLSKMSLVVIGFVFSVILVYGAAIIGKIIKGQYLFESGITATTYLFLTLALFIPIILYTTFSSSKNVIHTIYVTLSTIVFLFFLYVSVYLISSHELASGTFFIPDKTNKLVILFLCTSFLIVGASHIGTKPKK
jgi:hypothetical protein